jgi:hypothetical protein
MSLCSLCVCPTPPSQTSPTCTYVYCAGVFHRTHPPSISQADVTVCPERTLNLQAHTTRARSRHKPDPPSLARPTPTIFSHTARSRSMQCTIAHTHQATTCLYRVHTQTTHCYCATFQPESPPSTKCANLCPLGHAPAWRIGPRGRWHWHGRRGFRSVGRSQLMREFVNGLCSALRKAVCC